MKLTPVNPDFWGDGWYGEVFEDENGRRIYALQYRDGDNDEIGIGPAGKPAVSEPTSVNETPYEQAHRLLRENGYEVE